MIYNETMDLDENFRQNFKEKRRGRANIFETKHYHHHYNDKDPHLQRKYC